MNLTAKTILNPFMALSSESDSKVERGFDRPFALCIGPQRAGTSWLDRYLRHRGDICMPSGVKEIFFFDRHFERGFSFYKSHFAPQKDDKLIMEISTTSFDHEDAPKRVFDTLGKNITLICPLRNPVIRSYSLYLHYLRYGIVKGSLKEACFQNPQIIESSKYAKNLKRWLDYYPEDQIKILFQEDLEKSQDTYVKKVCEAMGIPYKPVADEASSRYNVTTYSKSGLLAAVAQRTADFLRKYKLYFLINIAKAFGLKRVVFGKEKPDAGNTDIPEADRLWLEEQLSGQVEELEALIGPIPQWH